MLADVFPTNKLGVVMGTVLTAHTVGFAIGPAIGGFLYEYAGFGAPFIFCSSVAAFNLLTIVWLAEPDHSAKDKGYTSDQVSRAQEDVEVTESTPLIRVPTEPKQIVTMLSLMKNWRVMSCVLCVTVSASVFAGIEPALPIHLQKVYNASASTIGCKYNNVYFKYF
jgi:MFS family permease